MNKLDYQNKIIELIDSFAILNQNEKNKFINKFFNIFYWKEISEFIKVNFLYDHNRSKNKFLNYDKLINLIELEEDFNQITLNFVLKLEWKLTKKMYK